MVQGKVIDAETNDPLAFVNILINNSQQGACTDIDGRFVLRFNEPVSRLRLSYVGYQAIDTTGNFYGNIVLQMHSKGIDLQEVIVLPGENPAHRIMLLAIKNRDENDPANLDSYKYKAYNRMVFTVAIEDKKKLDSLPSEKVDSSVIRLRNYLKAHDLFLMESVSEKKYRKPGNTKETILSSRVSGFQNPNFTLLASQMQSFSLYRDYISISDKNYLNPLCPGSTSKYFFLIEDTIYQNKDTVFVISYRPMKGKNFDGLKGVLYINSFKWALQNVIAEPYVQDAGTTVKIQQKFDLLDEKTWFPNQINVDITFNTVRLDNYPLVGLGRTYLSDIEINPVIPKSDFDRIELEIADSANKSKKLIDSYRGDSLSARDLSTYRVMDSIGKKENLDLKFKIFETLLTNKIPWGIVDMDINRFFEFNDYDGFRLGAGLYTNKKVSKWFSLGGYGAYAFRAKKIRYGASAEIYFDKPRDHILYAEYQKDTEENGGLCYTIKKNSFALMPENYRDFMVNRMDETEKYEAGFRTRVFKYFTPVFFMRNYSKQLTTDYAYSNRAGNVSISSSLFYFTEAGVSVRWANKEKAVQSFGLNLASGTKWPIVYGEFVHGMNNILDGSFIYDKVLLSADKDFQMRNIGKLSIRLSGGMVEGEVPLCNQFNMPSSYRDFTIHAPYSFATMRMNEFYADRWASIFVTHNFGKLLFNGKFFHPEIIVAGNALIGDMSKVWRHQGVSFEVPKKGYYEAGLLFGNLIRSGFTAFGFGGFYRLGPYSFAEPKDNISLKFTIGFLL
ncbi:MAG: DUF5686 and carboxypeptidase regulatory-like domain-containing protein [Bacteroidetes bacterium]|nr:DUF5686 and carboxypeptidase regulatory-like domain-containing protein [Bacteroidota bacterium]